MMKERDKHSELSVSLSKAFRFEADEMVVSVKPSSWSGFFQEKSTFGDDFLAERDNAPPQQREAF